MPVRVISVDFWNTLVVAATGSPEREAIRMRRLSAACDSIRCSRPDDHIRSAYRHAQERFNEEWLGERRTPSTDRFVRWIWDTLDIQVTGREHDHTVDCFRNVLLDHPPGLAPGVETTLRHLADRYPLVIISDTMVSPGRTIRNLLELQGLLDLFSGFVFSDETGFAKPDRRAFEAAAAVAGATTRELMHVGDLKPTDIAGARESGARAVLFTGIHHDQSDGPEPDVELRSWTDLPSLV